MSTDHPDAGDTFGAVDPDDLDFGHPVLDTDHDAFFSIGGFAERVENAAVDHRLVPGQLFAEQSRAPETAPVAPSVASPPDPEPAPTWAGAEPPAEPSAAPGSPATPVAPVAPVVAPFATAPPVATPPPYTAGAAPGTWAPVRAADAVEFGPGTVAVPIPSTAPVAPPQRRPRRGRLVAAALGLVLIGGGAAAGAYHVGFFGAPGAQPESVVPASAFAFADLDLNPSAGQKLAAYRLARKFPGVDASSPDGLKESVLVEALEGNPYGLTYADIGPWLGDRAAVAALPAPGTDDGVTPLLVLQVSDQTAAEESLSGIAAKVAGAGGDGTDVLAHAFRDDYVLLSDNQAEVDAAAAATGSLEQDPTFDHDMEELGSDQLATAWAHIGRTFEVIPQEERAHFAKYFEGSPAGSLVLGARADASYVEVTGHAFGVRAGTAAPPATTTGTGLVERLPADASVAFAVSGFGEGVTGAWAELVGTDALGIGAASSTFGLDLPEDLAAVFGDELAAAGNFSDSSGSSYVVTARTDEPGRATSTLTTVFEQFMGTDAGLLVETTTDGYVAGGNPDWVAEVASPPGGGLGDDPAFQQAVPDAATANAVLYVDIAALRDAWGSTDGPRELEPMKAFGASVAGDAEHVRLQARWTFE